REGIGYTAGEALALPAFSLVVLRKLS
ncbi:MAG: hypothetical protein QOD63_1938, partial [Actinomycetota bacterium]|nr:hypothetical protein [Actinomycetota bacterium]